jgi:hypothetical protein
MKRSKLWVLLVPCLVLPGCSTVSQSKVTFSMQSLGGSDLFQGNSQERLPMVKLVVPLQSDSKQVEKSDHHRLNLSQGEENSIFLVVGAVALGVLAANALQKSSSSSNRLNCTTVTNPNLSISQPVTTCR